MTKNVEVPKCSVCGKLLTNSARQDVGMGKLCEHRLASGYNATRLAEHRASMTVATIPEGYIKLARLDALVKASRVKYPGLTISKMVRAIGKDRATEPAIHPICTPIYDSRGHRWVRDWLATPAGLKAIQLSDFSEAPAK